MPVLRIQRVRVDTRVIRRKTILVFGITLSTVARFTPRPSANPGLSRAGSAGRDDRALMAVVMFPAVGADKSTPLVGLQFKLHDLGRVFIVAAGAFHRFKTGTWELSHSATIWGSTPRPWQKGQTVW
jgi:hypothetical protein